MDDCFKKIKTYTILILVLVFIAACSSGGGGDDNGSTPPDQEIEVAEIFVDTEPSTINVLESSTVTATAYDDSGSPISGVYVSFALDQPALAAISPAYGTTNSNGIARATLTARDKVGSVRITASSENTTSNEQPLSILSGVSPDRINVTATPTTILVEGTAAIQAEVLDSSGSPVPDGTSVSFQVANETFGSMSPAEKTTINGFASATFQALNQPGNATIEVSVGSINNSVDVLINQTLPASIEFASAEPQRINIAGSGGVETSDIQFRVIDENGNPLSGTEVDMEIEKGPESGEYINGDPNALDKRKITVSSNDEGLARIILRSGRTAGPVTIKATIEVLDEYGNLQTFTASSSIISIGGGVPVASRFSVSSEIRNLPGLDYNGVTTDVTAWLSDRYGNVEVLEGTSVSFWAEAALSINASAVTNAEGTATVEARTQHPALSVNTGGQDVAPWPWEENLMAYVAATYGINTTAHPRDGQASIMVYTQGEEHFDDINANGAYDNEPFEDTHDDPFIDYNDNDSYNCRFGGGCPADLQSVDPTEIFNDVENDGTWDSFNGVWDSQKDIFTSTKLLITGRPAYVIIVPVDENGTPITPTNTFNIPDGESQNFRVLVCDRNLNPLAADSSMAMTMTVDVENGDKLHGFAADKVDPYGDISGLPGEFGFMESHLGVIEFNAVVYDKVAGNNFAAPIIITVDVEWAGPEGITEKVATSIVGTGH